MVLALSFVWVGSVEAPSMIILHFALDTPLLSSCRYAPDLGCARRAFSLSAAFLAACMARAQEHWNSNNKPGIGMCSIYSGYSRVLTISLIQLRD